MEKEIKNEKQIIIDDNLPPFFFGKDKSIKKLKREDFPYLSDEDFEIIEIINNTPGEGPYVE